MLELQYGVQFGATIDIANACFCHCFGSRVQATVFLHLEEHPVHLGPTAPGVETKPHHLPWT